MASIERFPYQALRAKEGQNSTEFYNEAIAGGFEGIMVKDLNGLYESGKRKWIKYKPPRIDFDVLNTGARCDPISTAKSETAVSNPPT